MPLRRTPSLRKSTATKLRSLAERFEPSRGSRPRGSKAPLVRIGGRWWKREELFGEVAAADAEAEA
jgi:hypothetical protein